MYCTCTVERGLRASTDILSGKAKSKIPSQARYPTPGRSVPVTISARLAFTTLSSLIDKTGLSVVVISRTSPSSLHRKGRSRSHGILWLHMRHASVSTCWYLVEVRTSARLVAPRSHSSIFTSSFMSLTPSMSVSRSSESSAPLSLAASSHSSSSASASAPNEWSSSVSSSRACACSLSSS